MPKSFLVKHKKGRRCSGDEGGGRQNDINSSEGKHNYFLVSEVMSQERTLSC